MTVFLLILILILLWMPDGSSRSRYTRAEWDRIETDRAETEYLMEKRAREHKEAAARTRTFRRRVVHPDGRLEELAGREETFK